MEPQLGTIGSVEWTLLAKEEGAARTVPFIRLPAFSRESDERSPTGGSGCARRCLPMSGSSARRPVGPENLWGQSRSIGGIVDVAVPNAGPSVTNFKIFRRSPRPSGRLGLARDAHLGGPLIVRRDSVGLQLQRREDNG